MKDEFIHIDKTFTKTIFINDRLDSREFDGCVFRKCDFSGSTLSGCSFIDCEFIDCNLAMAKFPGSGLKTVTFTNCKMLGIRFDECDDFLFAVTFYQSVLDYSWFSRKKMPKTLFTDSALKGVNFEQADLTSAVFSNCNLEGAIFNESNLTSADFTTSYNYRLDPEMNTLKKARFSTQGIVGLLDKYDINIE